MKLLAWIISNLKTEKTHYSKISEKALEAALKSLLLKKSILDNTKTATIDEIKEYRLRELFVMTVKNLICFFKNNEKLLTCQGEQEVIVNLENRLNDQNKYTTVEISQYIKEELLKVKEHVFDEGFVLATFNFTLKMRVFQHELLLNSVEKELKTQKEYSNFVEKQIADTHSQLKQRMIKKQYKNVSTRNKSSGALKKHGQLSQTFVPQSEKKPNPAGYENKENCDYENLRYGGMFANQEIKGVKEYVKGEDVICAL